MIFPRAPLAHGIMVLRHPSQLYEAGLEGLVLSGILWFIAQRQHSEGVLLGTFLTLYGLFCYFIEFFREPDSQLGLIGGIISMGQILSLAMIIVGIAAIVRALCRHPSKFENLPTAKAPQAAYGATEPDVRRF
jgi:prolipoprotein diacylglyceryltransferase